MYIIVLITAANKKEAGKIASGLVRAKLAACVNIIEGVKSLFWWKEKLEKAQESFLIAKSTKGKLKPIIKLVKSLHSYQVPEIIALPISAGNKEYLEWINASVG
jgi:periplasmic divalent cation tolerance protein